MAQHSIAAQVAKAIEEAGAEAGGGTPLTAILVQQGPPSGPEWDPQPGERIEHTITVVDTHRVVRAGGDMLGKAEHILRMAATGPIPAITDEVVIGGVTYAVADVKPLAPGGIVLMWEVKLDR